MRGINTVNQKPLIHFEQGPAGGGIISEKAMYSFITDEESKTINDRSQDASFQYEKQQSLSQKQQLRDIQLEEKRRRFKDNLRMQIQEDKDGEYGLISNKLERPGLDLNGRLTQEFIDDLRDFKEEEMLNLEESIKNARQPSEDMFGIKRRFCTVCLKGCIGYEPINMLIPNMVGGGNVVFPPELGDTVKNYNIGSKDVNYNCVVAVFQVRDTERYQNNLNELMTIIKEEGLEILQMDKRDLDVEEAIYIKSRMVGQAEIQIQKLLGIHDSNLGKQTNIRQDAFQGSSMQTRLGAKDPFIMNQYADEKELKLQKMQQTMMNQKSNQNIQYVDGIRIEGGGGLRDKSRDLSANQRKQVTFKDQVVSANNNNPNMNNNQNINNLNQQQQQQQLNPNKFNNMRQNQNQMGGVNQQNKQGLLMESINQRVALNSSNMNNTVNSGATNRFGRADSIARTSNLDSVYNQNISAHLDPLAFSKRETVLPVPKEKIYKIKTFSKSSTQVKRKLNTLHYRGDLATQEVLMTQQIEDNPLLRELITKDVLILAIGSSTFQNLDTKLKTSVMVKIQQFVPPYEMPMLYLSDNKILALEDSITFFPALFKLTKSIVITEQLIEFNNVNGDISSYAQVQLAQDDLKSIKLNEKLRDLMQELHEDYSRDAIMEDPNRDMQGELDENEDEGFYRNRKTLARKISTKLKKTIVKRETMKQAQMSGKYSHTLTSLKPTQTNQLAGAKDDTLLEWIEKTKHFEQKNKKKQRLLTKKNKNLYNYGVMQDFFSYSAMKIQNSLKEVDVNEQMLQSATGSYKINEGVNKLKGGNQNLANIYAIAKVGLANLILPNALDVKLSNYNNYVSYMRMSDIFFPELSHSQFSVLILRPLIVKNGLNDMFIQILKVNDFTIVKRKVRMLSKSEVIYLAEVEQITKDKAEMYYNLMMDGDSEIVVVSKMGAVEDLQTLVDGCKPYGRRRVPQLYEDEKSGVRGNVDSINGMFEITPFTSFSEFIDLEDFIVGHTRLEKYKKLYKEDGNLIDSKLENQLYFYKIDQIRRELNLFQRFFNLAALAAPSHKEAQKEICVLMPEVASIEESVIILNPIYNTYKEQAGRLLERMGFKVIKQSFIKLRSEDVEKIFNEKISTDYKSYMQTMRVEIAKELELQRLEREKRERTGATLIGAEGDRLTQTNEFSRDGTLRDSKLQKTFRNSCDRLGDLLIDTQINIYHICKVAGDREIRQLYLDSQIEYEDMFRMKCKTTPYRPNQFPLLFIFMDTPTMFEEALKVIYPYQYVEVTASDLQDQLKHHQKFEILNNTLLTTIGDEIKSLIFDKEGNILNGKKKEELNQYAQTESIPQIFQLFSNPKGNHAIHFLVESEQHGLYEIRYQRLPHRGDFYSEANEAHKVNLQSLRMRYYTRFQTLNFYYNEVNKRYFNICPAFYRFRICPLHHLPPPGQPDTLNRVYEVEEYMGKLFIEDLSNQHQDHIRMQKHNRMKIGWQMLTETQQKSLPPYIWGVRLCQMSKDLEKIIPTQSQIEGAGRIKFDQGKLKGVCSNIKDYFVNEKKRYEKILEQFKLGWGYYLNVLEQELIEEKLTRILESFTFKYSRMPGMMAFVPDRMTETNLRISEKMKFLVPESLEETEKDKRDHTLRNKEKFFTHLKEDLINAESEKLRSTQVQSIIHALHVNNVKTTLDKVKEASITTAKTNLNSAGPLSDTKLQQESKGEKDQKQYSIHKDVAIVGCEVAIRTKYHLIASLLYLFNFWYRKVERRTEFFEDIERQAYQPKQHGEDPEKDYDMILDILVKSFQENYGDDEFNYALDMAKLNQEEENEFERGMREKAMKEQKRLERLQQRTYEQHRLLRTTMSIKDLIERECNIPQREYEEKQRVLLKKFVESKGQYDSAGEGFLETLRQTQVFLGPYSIKLANDYLKRFEKAEKSKQEKISLVKMEYFLYGVNEAHRIVEELKAMESKLVGLLEDVEIKKKSAGFISNAQQNQNNSKYYDTTSDNRLHELQQLEEKIERTRQQISSKEAELVLSFRELVSWDYMVPDYYFDANQLLQFKNQKRSEAYTVPFKTFWIPINIDALYEPNLTMRDHALKIRNYENAPKLQLKNLQWEEDEPQPYQKGVLIAYLRPYNNRQPSDYLKFDKYYSLGEQKQYQEITKIRDIIKVKSSKEEFKYGTMFTSQ